jgi:hypothetical protein
VNARLRFARRHAGQGVRIKIAQAQQGLEKQHGGCPDRRAAAEPGQDLLADKRLNLKQQKCAGEDG